ncbi:nucleoside-diphosphate kinase [bacterium]|nr:MAG: nucleoside-diphosphate kinase [bacterium]
MKKERTLVIIKPDGVQRGLIGEIIHRIERTGLKLVAAKFVLGTEEQGNEHYKKDDVWLQAKGELRIKQRTEAGKPIEKTAREYGMDIVKGNVAFITAGPVFPMIWEGNKAVGIIKKIVGGTEPLTSDVGTIRGDLTIDSYDLSNEDNRCVRNLLHCTDDSNESEREINLWFKPEEILDYRQMNEQMLYDINLDGILE